MGEATFVNQSSSEPKRATHIKHGIRFGLDFILICAAAALTLFGLLMVYSASPLAAARMEESANYFLGRQVLWTLLGTACIIFAVSQNYRLLKRVSVILMVGTLALLILVPLFGHNTFGAVRSILPSSIRPSELAKIVVLIYVAVWLDAKSETLNDLSLGLIPLIVILGINAGIILIQPDLSAAFTVIILGVLMFFLAGAEWRQIALILIGSLIVGWIFVNFVPGGRDRVDVFLKGLSDPNAASEHIRMSFQAIKNGGLFGVGIGMSALKFIGLPVAHTDSIFAVLAEETGLIGIALLLSCFLVILWRGLTIAHNAPDRFGRLLAAGVTFWIIIEAFINICVMVNLLPNAGNALPFISYGGSSLVTTMAGVGILLSIGRAAEEKKVEGEQTFGAVVDLRWRDRRRRVSRSVRSASPRS
jgi:cell division protein FtsW